MLLPDEVYKSLKDEAERRELTVAEIVRRGIDGLLASSVASRHLAQVITPRDLGVPMIPENEWRDRP